MIFILHGADSVSSYQRLSQIVNSYPKHRRLNLSDEKSLESFWEGLSGDLFQTEKIIICENFISEKIISSSQIEKVPKESPVIFWEHKELAPRDVLKFNKLAKVEKFKPKTQIFWFLDSISPDVTGTLKAFSEVGGEEPNLIWHLSNRFLLLVVAKLSFSSGLAEKLSKRGIEDWQWERIQKQSNLFEFSSLISLYKAFIKLDFMIKTGATSQDEKSLIIPVLLKNLAR